MIRIGDLIYDMQWKQLKVSFRSHFVVFEIIPYYHGRDVLIFPSDDVWEDYADKISKKEIKSIIHVIRFAGWKRSLSVVRSQVPLHFDKELPLKDGMLELTPGYKEFSEKHLFDPGFGLKQFDVKKLYCTLEYRYAMACSGKVVLPRRILLPGSVMNEITYKALLSNENAEIVLV